MREALLESAQKLIAEQGPTKVRLREIAEAAGVNFGLVYQYLGTREQLLHAVYQRVSARSAIRFEHVDKLADAVDIMMSVPDYSIGRIMGWAALEGDLPGDVFGHSPALDQVTAIIMREAAQHGREPSEEEARVLAAFIQVTALGWRLFRQIGLAAADAEAIADTDRQATAWLQMLAESVVRGDQTKDQAPPS